MPRVFDKRLDLRQIEMDKLILLCQI